MKRGLVALLLGLCAAAVSAQNLPTYPYVNYAQGNPGFEMNSNGSNYGQLFNNSNAQSWSLGYGTSLTVNGTSSLQWDNHGNVIAEKQFAGNITSVGSGQGTGFGVIAGTMVPVNSPIETIIGVAGNNTLTSLPEIATTTADGSIVQGGTFLLLSSTQAIVATSSVTFTDNGGSAGSCLLLGSATRVVGGHCQLQLEFMPAALGESSVSCSAGMWKEINYVCDPKD